MLRNKHWVRGSAGKEREDRGCRSLQFLKKTTRPQKTPKGRHKATPRKKLLKKKKPPSLHSHLVGLFFLLSESAQIYRSENLARFVSRSQAERSRSCLGAVLVFCYGCNMPETPFLPTLCILRSQPLFLNSSSTPSVQRQGENFVSSVENHTGCHGWRTPLKY